MINYNVYRNGKCTKCGQMTSEFIANVEAENKEEAIDKAIAQWSYDNFGQAGALRENDLAEEELFLEADFVAIEEIEKNKDA